MAFLEGWLGLEVFQHLTQLRQEEEGEQYDDDQTDYPDDRHRGHPAAAKRHTGCAL